MASGPIRWLHISDLHMGCRGTEIWWQVRDDFKQSIRQHFQPIDMILVTGDLTFAGIPEHFDLFDKFVDELLGWLRQAGQATDPVVIPVPGNHDLIWQTRTELRNYRVLENFWKDPDHEDLSILRDQLWQDLDASLFDRLFGNYAAWLKKSILPRLEGCAGVTVYRSHFPGDLSVFLNLPDRPPVTVVGLNSSWVQYNNGDFDRRIELFTQQLHWALGDRMGGSPLDRLAGRLNFLLMHHPLTWLSAKASQRFKEEIYPPDRFLLCLHGHMHEGRSEALSQSGGKFRYFFQAPSLFGLEHYGSSNETRAIGYAWGEVDAAGTVRVWPLKRSPQGGRQVFLWDTEFEHDPAGRRLRPLAVDTEVAVAPSDLTPWLEALLDRIGYIEISGIGSGVARTRDASRYPIERLYTMLRSRDATAELAGRSGPVSLAELMTRYPLLLIEGQPGAGKTTFLRLVATMLVRDLLRVPCPQAPTWREKYLGMASRDKPLVPLFLRLSDLSILLAQTKPQAVPDDHRRLLDLIAHTPNADAGEAWRRDWEGRLGRGEAILLLDGLDEIADDRMRERVFAIFRDAHRHWSKARVVVTTRPFGAEAVREMGFHHAVIQDFGKEEIRECIERWVAALYNLPIGERPEGVAGEKADRIIQDVFDRHTLRRLAANPVMLTCLCVVHWNEGELPEGRARLYRAVIRWLIAARSPQREAAGFTDQFARESFAALAFAMMGAVDGAKAAVFDFESGAEVVRSLAERHFFDGTGIRRARDWLRFECLWSGIVEKSADGKIRFWHLTFQEYLAAQELAWRRDKDGAEDWWPVVKGRLDDLQWRETADLLPGVLFDEGGGGRVDLLLRRVIVLRQGAASLATDARVFGIMGRIIGQMTPYQYKPPPEIEVLYRDLRERILSIFEREGAARVPVETRIEAAEALGRGGDPRLDGDSFIPVPGTGVSLGKYPVTVQEYQVFVDADGYQEAKYWDEEEWRLRGERGWGEPDGWDQQLEHPNWPVTGVSWYEARAFCRWRSSDSDWVIRLPTESEWVAAATPDGRTYPWKRGEPDPERANFGGNVGSASPVGIYPAGDGAYNHSDLAGNVWEWVGDIWHDSYDGAPSDGSAWTDAEGKQSSRNRVIRGGSWINSPRVLRSADRYGDEPDYRDVDLGFRVARTLV